MLDFSCWPFGYRQLAVSCNNCDFLFQLKANVLNSSIPESIWDRSKVTGMISGSDIGYLIFYIFSKLEIRD